MSRRRSKGFKGSPASSSFLYRKSFQVFQVHRIYLLSSFYWLIVAAGIPVFLSSSSKLTNIYYVLLAVMLSLLFSYGLLYRGEIGRKYILTLSLLPV
jgi:hypothetical protein